MVDTVNATVTPSIPSTAGIKDPATARFLGRLKELLEVKTGVSGDALDQWVSFRDLYNNGMLTLPSGQSTVRLPGVKDAVWLPTGSGPAFGIPPAVTGFSVSGALVNMILTWDQPTYANHAYTEIWRSGTNDLGTAVKVGTTPYAVYADTVGSTGVTRYYWVRNVSTANVAGPFNATAGTAGSTGLVGTADLADALITAQKLAAGAVSGASIAAGAIDASKFVTTVKPVEIFSSLPAPGNQGRIVLLTIDNKLYRDTGTVWTTAIPTTDLTGQITTGQITANAITSALIASGAVGTAQIANQAVTTALIANAAVGTTQIANAAITSALLASGAVGIVNLASGLRPVEILGALPAAGTQGRTVLLTTDNKLYRDTGTAWTTAVPTTDLTGQITTGQITDASITLAKFASGLGPVSIVGALPTLPSASYPQGAVVALTTDNKLYRSTGSAWTKATDGADIVANSITAAQIAAATITTTQIAAATIVGGNIAAGTITASNLLANTITAAQIAAGTITTTQIASGTIVAGNIAAGTITSALIAAATIVSSNIAAGTITGSNIAAGTITASNLLANTITAGQIAAGAIGTTQLAATAVRADKLIVGNFDNLAEDPGFESNLGSWVPGSGWTLANDPANAHGGNYVAKRTGTGTATTVEVQNLVKAPCRPGDEFYFEGYVKADVSADGSAGVRLAWLDVNGAVLSYSTAFRTPGTSYLIVANSAVAPANTVSVRVEVYVANHSAGTWYVDDIYFKQRIITAYISDAAITTAKIANAAITNAQIGNLAVATANIQDAAITNAKIGLLAVDTANIANGAIATAKIATAAVGAAQIANATITNAQIANATILGGNIAASTITASNIAAGTITATQMATGTITAASGIIADAAIGTAKIVDANITTLKVAGNAITVPVSAYTAGAISTSTSQTNVQSITITTDGSPVQLIGAATCYTTNISNVTMQIYRDTTALSAATGSVDVANNSVVMTTIVVDAPAAGTYIYYLYVSNSVGTGTAYNRALSGLMVKR